MKRNFLKDLEMLDLYKSKGKNKSEKTFIKFLFKAIIHTLLKKKTKKPTIKLFLQSC